MDRDKQIEFMENAEKRAQGYLRAWLQNPEFKAALHRYDRDGHDCRQAKAGNR
jgi:hypothetical protein